MQSPITDRKTLLHLANSIRQHLGPEDAPLASQLDAALQWAANEPEDSALTPYTPSNETLSLLQSTFQTLSAEQDQALEAPFDTSDPGWLSVAAEKLKALVRGKHAFIAHSSPDSFLYPLPDNAVVALVSDWGTGEPSARRVMEQIKAANPTHLIHLGDVYYSGTPDEVQARFLDVIAKHGPAPDTCRFFALNANHEMYSGGYGYFDHTLPAFHQEASYFNLSNQHWQLIGLDSGYEDFGLADPQLDWLTAQLNRPGPRSILLSHHQLFSPYEARAQQKKLFQKTSPLLPKVHAWFWGHEHKCIILGDYMGIKARCIGHGAIPADVPYGPPKFPEVPIFKVDERPSPEGGNIHGFVLLRFNGPFVEASYIDEFGQTFHREQLDVPAALPGPRAESPDPEKSAWASRFRRLLARRASAGDDETESVGDTELDLSPAAIQDRLGQTSAQLHQIVKTHLGDGPALHEIVDHLISGGADALHLFANEEPENLDAEKISAALEVVVKTDGSRPSFMVRNGQVDTTTSPVGLWAPQIAAATLGGDLTQALACVGRIDAPSSRQGFEGTGFLIHENLIITNRHVLQAIARPNSSGVWAFTPGAAIDFGHEFNAVASRTPRVLKQVAFCPAKLINKPLDHSKLDLVLIELEPTTLANLPRQILGLDISPQWTGSRFVYIAGYPADPGLGETLTLLEQLFQSTFGYKRLAPGERVAAQSPVAPWTVAHDASTLGGNSGSAIFAAGREGVAAALHYGGTRAIPRENWGHLLGLTLQEPDARSGKSLLDTLNSFGVQLIDRTPR